MKPYAYIAALVLVLGALWGVYHAGQRSTQAKWDAEKTRVEADYKRRLKVVTDDSDKTKAALAAGQSTLLELQAQLAEASKKKTLTRTVLIPAPPEAPHDCPACSCPVLDSGFVGLFDAARAASGPTPSR